MIHDNQTCVSWWWTVRVQKRVKTTANWPVWRLRLVKLLMKRYQCRAISICSQVFFPRSTENQDSVSPVDPATAAAASAALASSAIDGNRWITTAAAAAGREMQQTLAERWSRESCYRETCRIPPILLVALLRHAFTQERAVAQVLIYQYWQQYNWAVPLVIDNEISKISYKCK